MSNSAVNKNQAKLKHCVIYIPGLNDRADVARRYALKLWRLHGVKALLVPMRWYGNEPYSKKKIRILEAIDKVEKQGYTVSLIGESAGASIAINIAAEHPSLHALATIAGVASPNATVSPSIYARSPVFKESMQNLQTSLYQLQPNNIITFSAKRDSVVNKKYSVINGATNITLPTAGHFFTIMACLTFKKQYIITSIKTR